MRNFGASLLAFIFLTGSSFQAPQIRVEVEAVNVLVTVTDKQGRFVTDIPAHRFEVFDEGVRQKITNFQHETELPLQVAILIDTSSSVRLQLGFEKEAVTQFVRTVLRPQDQALLVEFDTGLSLVHDFTNKPSAISQAIRGLRAGGGTALLDALYKVCQQKLVRGGARKAIVVISDGVDLHSRHSPEEALEMVQRRGVVIYAISSTRLRASPESRGEKRLKELAERTGGRPFFPYSSTGLHQAFDQIDEELRSQYSLTYTPLTRKKKKRDYRKIRVKIRDDKDLTIRHRKGYFTPQDQPES